MKTVSDLFKLIIKETAMNEGKTCKFVFSINTQHGWVSMYREVDIEGEKPAELFALKSIKTPAEVQEVYWMIWNHGRSRNLDLDVNKAF